MKTQNPQILHEPEIRAILAILKRKMDLERKDLYRNSPAAPVPETAQQGAETPFISPLLLAA